MSTNTLFDQIMSAAFPTGLNREEVCEACEENNATMRVSYACGSEANLLCAQCLDDYLAYMLKRMLCGAVTGHEIAHDPCNTPLRSIEDILTHVHPEELGK